MIVCGAMSPTEIRLLFAASMKPNFFGLIGRPRAEEVARIAAVEIDFLEEKLKNAEARIRALEECERERQHPRAWRERPTP